jgi:glycosyltransferase involved in cell wall biosynthesis
LGNRILIDLGKLKNLNCGLGQYSLYFAKYLSIAELNTDEYKLYYLLPKDFINVFGTNINYINLSFLKRLFHVYSKNMNLYHAIHQDSAFMPPNKHVPYIITIHDLNFLDEKNPYKRDKRLNLLQAKVNRATAIIAISEYTKQIILKHLNISNQKIKVIYNGLTLNSEIYKSKPTFIENKDKFLFTIGAINPKKNFSVLINFMKYLPDYKLIIAGDNKTKYAKEIYQSIYNNNLHNRIIMPGKISEEEKYWLYNNCVAFVFPSKYEGFGLPVIEAMSFGKPVFISKLSSLPEIGGNEAYYWTSFDANIMANTFIESMKSFNKDISKINRLKKHAASFSWNKNIEETINLYKEIL